MIPIAQPILGKEERGRVETVLRSGKLADGAEVRQFETEFAEFCDTEYALATSNGTTALHAAIEALELEPGARVVTTPFSFIASANAIRLAGGKPIFADIDPATLNIDSEAVKARIEAEDDGVQAILAVHLYGNPAPMEALRRLADRFGIYLIEDAAQAHGARFQGETVGSIGDVGCFSFYPTKNMTTGEGGMITTDNENIYERAARYINHGRTDQYEHADLGHNFRMTNMAAAMGRAQLERLDEFTEARRRNARKLTKFLRDTSIKTPTEQPGGRHVYHQYTVRTPDREALQAYLETNDVGNAIYYPRCIHNQPAYSGYEVTAPKAELASEEVLSLPVHPGLSVQEVETVGRRVTAFDGGR